MLEFQGTWRGFNNFQIQETRRTKLQLFLLFPRGRKRDWSAISETRPFLYLSGYLRGSTNRVRSLKLAVSFFSETAMSKTSQLYYMNCEAGLELELEFGRSRELGFGAELSFLWGFRVGELVSSVVVCLVHLLFLSFIPRESTVLAVADLLGGIGMDEKLCVL